MARCRSSTVHPPVETIRFPAAPGASCQRAGDHTTPSAERGTRVLHPGHLRRLQQVRAVQRAFLALGLLVLTLFAFLVGLVTYAVGLAIGSLIIYYVAFLAIFLPGLAVSVRRLHDVGRSGWWYLLAFTLIGGLVLLFWAIQPSEGPNKYGNGPDTDASHSAAPSLA